MSLHVGRSRQWRKSKWRPIITSWSESWDRNEEALGDFGGPASGGVTHTEQWYLNGPTGTHARFHSSQASLMYKAWSVRKLAYASVCSRIAYHGTALSHSLAIYNTILILFE